MPDDQLRDRVVETLRKHWPSPRPCVPTTIPAEKVEDRAREILATMLTRQFRVGPLPSPEAQESMLQRVRRCVVKGGPVQVVVGYGPLKNQNAINYSRADWAEFFALGHLVAWHNKVQSVYPPGLSLNIAFDDTTLVMANRVDSRLMDSYMSSIRRLLVTLKYDGLIKASLKHSLFAWLFHFGLYQWAAWRVRRWDRDPANREQVQKMDEAAARNLVVPTGLSQAQQAEYIRAASRRYRVYWEALQLSGLTRSRTRLVGMYLDGSQHHIRDATALHLTSLDKGQVTQPWQGGGALLDNGHGKLEPFVMTAGRRQRYTVQTVDGLDVLPELGFESIGIATALKSEPSVGEPRSVGETS
jgi:hypothetical protein